MRSRWVIAAGFVALLASCDESGPAATSRSAGEKTGHVTDEARHVLQQSEAFELEYDEAGPAASPVVVLIGENHASVAAQIQLADLLESVLERQLIDAVLVEGSNGELDAGSAASQFREAAEGSSLDDLWRRQLEWGMLAGYEYVALKRPALPVLGIEDMGAKARYEVSQVVAINEERVSGLVDSTQRSLSRLTDALSALEDAGVSGLNESRELISRLGPAIADYDTKLRALSKEQQPTTNLLLEQVRLRGEAQAAFARVQPELEDVQRWQSQLEQREPAYERRVDAFNRRVEQYQRTPGLEAPAGLLGERSAIDAEEAELLRLASKVSSFANRFGADLEALRRTGERLEEIESEQAAVAAGLGDLASAVTDAQESARDIFFSAANRLSAIAREAWGYDLSTAAPDVRRRLLALDSFHVDEQREARERQLADAKEKLIDRDSAMAQNILEYLRSSGSRAVVAVVGYAHLTGMAEQLSQRGIAFFAGGLSGNEEYELWEPRTWADRRSPTAVVFTTPEELKEISRFLDTRWVDETSALIARARRIELPETFSTSAILGEQRVLHVGKHLSDQRVNVGEHIVARGPVPGQPGVHFEVYDRARAKELVSELSDDGTRFAYAFEGESEYRLLTPAGEQSLADFKVAPERADSDYVVLFHEPDTVEQSGFAVSELWDSFRPAGAGGGGKPPTSGGGPRLAGAAPEPPPGKGPGTGGERAGGEPGSAGGAGGDGGEPPGGAPWYQAGFSGEGPRNDKGFFRTNNPRRAARNVAALRRQKGIQPEEVTIREHPTSLLDVPFTPRDGEHAGLVLLLARNEVEFRAAVQQAATARKLENKQVALITCGDAFAETRALRETILDGDALIVWTPSRQLTEAAGQELLGRVRGLLDEARSAGRSFRDIDDLVNEAIGTLRREQPTNAELEPLTNSSSWTLTSPRADDPKA